MVASPEPGNELAHARRLTDELFALICPGALYDRPVPERHRLVFYLGHLEAFDWNMICRWGLSVPAFHEEFDRLFAFGIDPGADGLPQDKPADWPSLEKVHQYNARVRETLDRVIADAPGQLLHVAIEHRLMHAETFAYLMHNLDYEKKVTGGQGHGTGRPGDGETGGQRDAATRRHGDAATRQHPGAPRAWIEVPAGAAVLGRPRGDGFGWDNEFNEHQVDMPAFGVAKHKVTNGEYLEFVRAGGPAPHFWIERRGQWMYRGMFNEIPLPLDWPVYVTHEQASAYAQWMTAALPSEAQWHRAAEGARPAGNLDFRFWDPVSVRATPEGDSKFGVSQLIGNGWEWTSSVFQPFPGFQEFPFYPGYSANFFDGEHYVLKGASPRTALRLARHSFRNWFRPGYPYLYATFRLATRP
jgi:gamma-glutamyl hercynylcysteine S-oxide synthase